jgi:sugar lactone lactonase YvrE
MISTSLLAGPVFRALRQTVVAACGAAVLVLAGCGGSADAPPPPEGGTQCVAPAITQQPANASVTAAQNASFTVVATGTAPLTYQWQRNGVDIEGATAATYTLATTLLDSATVFRAVVANCAGSTTSNGATLTVTAAAPVLTITQQPANISVVAGTSASFAVAGTCSSGTLVVQWQRSQGSGAGLTFADIAGATALTFTLPTAIGDSGAQFRANLSCSGQSAATSNVATLTVTPPGGVTLSLLPLVGLRDQADIGSATGIDQDAGGTTFTFITASTIKRLSADLSTITPVAGTPAFGSADGPSATASFNFPFALTHDAAGNIYIADSGNNTIRRIASDGTVSTLAGLAGSNGSADGSGSAARFDSPVGIAMGPDGDLYVADRNTHLIRRVTTAGVVTTYAGSSQGYVDGAPLTAKFSSPWGVAVAANGDVLIADASNNRIRRVVRAGNVAGSVETLAGNGTFNATDSDGIGTAAIISQPRAIVLRGNTLTLRDNFGLLRQIDLTTKAVTTFAGSRTLGSGNADGTLATARIRDTGLGLTTAPNGGFMLADDLAVRSVSASGTVFTIASHAAIGITPTGIGTLPQMPFGLAINDPQGVTVDPAGNVVVASDFQTVRRISPTGVVTLAAGLTGGLGAPIDGVGSEAQFAQTGYAIASDSTGAVYVADEFGLRKVAADNTTTTPAGSPINFGAVDGNGATARFNRIFGLAAGPGGVVYAADAGNNAVRRIDAAGNVTTYAGVMGQSGSVDGPIATARFIGPGAVALAPDGSLYVADGSLRRVAADGSSVSTIAAAGFQIIRLAVDASGTVYYTTPSGLFMLPQGGASTLLIPVGGATVLGSSPHLFGVDGLAVLGPKQLVILGGSQILVATLP